MKNSAVLASLLFGSFAVAAPFDKRALVYATEIVTETVVIYTTVYEDEPVSTSSAEGLFYEQPQVTSSVVVPPTSSAAPAYTPPAPVEEPSSVYTPPPQTPSPTPTPAPAPEPTTEEAKPTTTEAAYVAPAPAAPSAAPQVDSQPSTSNAATTGEKFSNVDITIYDNNGGYGACGTQLYDTDMIVAIAKGAWGESTYDVMTGASTNKWCNQKIQVEYEGNTIQATVMDLCPGCTGTNDIDLSLAAWKALTGKDEKTRLKASWSKIA